MLDFNQPIETLSGQPVTILTTEARGKMPILGHIGSGSSIEAWTVDGAYLPDGSPHQHDLRNVPRTHEVWFNFYPGLSKHDAPIRASSAFPSREAADAGATHGRIACLPLSVREGDGI